MSNKKANNLLVHGKKAALWALALALTFGQAKMWDKLFEIEEKSKTEVVDNEQGQENKKSEGFPLSLIVLCSFAGVMWTAMYFVARKMPEEELRKQQKSFTL